ncbi:ATP-binding protein, partial [Bordetella pertussis]
TSLFNSGKPGGLGVGLALSHVTVEQLGGAMTMTAAEGGGARIRFTLPLGLGRASAKP